MTIGACSTGEDGGSPGRAESQPKVLDDKQEQLAVSLVESNQPEATVEGGDKYSTALSRLFPDGERRGVVTAATVSSKASCYRRNGHAIPEFDVAKFLLAAQRISGDEERDFNASRFFDKYPRARSVDEARELLESNPLFELVRETNSGYGLPEKAIEECGLEAEEALTKGTDSNALAVDDRLSDLQGLAQRRAANTEEVRAAGEAFAACMVDAGFDEVAPPDRDQLPSTDAELLTYWDCLDSSRFSAVFAEQTNIQELAVINDNREQILEMRKQHTAVLENADDIIAGR